MGMGLSLGSVSDATIQRLLADPALIWQVVAPDDSEMYDRALRSAPSTMTSCAADSLQRP